MGIGSFGYKLVYLLHLSAVIVGFGTSFAWPLIASKAKALGATAPKEAYAVGHAAYTAGKVLTTPVIYAAGAFGLILVLVSDQTWEFKQTWVSAAFVLFIGAALIAGLLHVPNLKAMDALSERLASGDAAPPAGGGPPPEVAELEERSGKAGMYGGILHLLWLLLMIDMIWKPGTGF